MADQLKTARVTNATQGKDQLPARIAEIEAALAFILGVPLDTLINNGLFTVDGVGLKTIKFQDLGGAPSALGNLARHGSLLKYHDGTSGRTVWHTGTQIPLVKTVNQSVTSSTTPVNDNALGTALEVGGFYDFTAQIFYTAPTAAGLKLVMSPAAAATIFWSVLGSFAGTFTSIILTGPDNAVLNGLGATVMTAWIQGVINMGATPGGIQLQFAQNVSDPGATTMIAGSRMFVRKLA